MSAQHTGHQRYNISLPPSTIEQVDKRLAGHWTNRSMLIDELLNMWLIGGAPRDLKRNTHRIHTRVPEELTDT